MEPRTWPWYSCAEPETVGLFSVQSPPLESVTFWARSLTLAAYLDQGPAAHGWDEDQVWTGARVATLIGRKFHVTYSVSGATRLMHRLGFSPQVPARRAAERDERAVTAWKEVTWTEVKAPGRPATD